MRRKTTTLLFLVAIFLATYTPPATAQPLEAHQCCIYTGRAGCCLEMYLELLWDMGIPPEG